jgi:hypothetical protein
MVIDSDVSGIVTRASSGGVYGEKLKTEPTRLNSDDTCNHIYISNNKVCKGFMVWFFPTLF